MKKAFTLIEIIITIVIIGIVLSMVTSLGNWFSDRIRFVNTKELITQSLQHIVQEAATTNAVYVGSGRVKYGILTLTIPAWSGNTIIWNYSSWDLTTPFSGKNTVDRGVIFSSGVTLTLTPYSVGCQVSPIHSLRVGSTENTKLHACFDIQSSTCKLQEVRCP